MKKILFIIIVIFSTVSAYILARDTIVIGNVPYSTADIDSITIDIEDNSPLKKIWRNGEFKSSDISSGENICLFEDFEISGRIYQFSCYDTPWKNVYLTPIGLFYVADYTSYLEYNITNDDGSYDDISYEREDYKGEEFWYYESFDKLHTAEMIVKDGYTLHDLDYNDGEVYIRYEDSVYIEHYQNENSKLTRRTNEFTSPSDEMCDLQKNAWFTTQTFDSYSYDNDEEELKEFINSFSSLIGLPVITVDGDSDNKITIAKKKAADRTKKKFKSADYAIVPMTYDVRGIYDESVRKINGALRCASYKGRNTLEYGILIDENRANLTSDKAAIKIPLKQQGLKLSFSAYANGLNSGTTYYYTTYCKIPKSELGTYHFRYGDKKRTEGYGHIKSFTTPKALWVKVDINSSCPYVENTDYRIFLRHVNYYYTGREDQFKDVYEWRLGKKDGWKHSVQVHNEISKNINFGIEPPIPCPDFEVYTKSDTSYIIANETYDYRPGGSIPSIQIRFSCGSERRARGGSPYWSYNFSYDISPCFKSIDTMFDNWHESIGSIYITNGWTYDSTYGEPWCQYDHSYKWNASTTYSIIRKRKDDGTIDVNEENKFCCEAHNRLFIDKFQSLPQALDTKFRFTYMGSADDIFEKYYFNRDMLKSKRAKSVEYGYGAAKPESESGIKIKF